MGEPNYVVGEMVPRGVSSTAFTAGALTQKDEYVRVFTERYLDIRGPLGSD